MVKRKKTIKAKNCQFIALSDGVKRTYCNEDGLSEYSDNIIRDPKKMSYINLFINGVLQPQQNYSIRRGVLRLNTIDVPPKGAPIIVQFIKLYQGSGSKRKKRRRKRASTYEVDEE